MAVSSTTSGILDPSASSATRHDPRLYNQDLAPTMAAQRT
jgi:cytosine/uracil/thiamine/allantoin permease